MTFNFIKKAPRTIERSALSTALANYDIKTQREGAKLIDITVNLTASGGEYLGSIAVGEDGNLSVILQKQDDFAPLLNEVGELLKQLTAGGQ